MFQKNWSFFVINALIFKKKFILTEMVVKWLKSAQNFLQLLIISIQGNSMCDKKNG